VTRVGQAALVLGIGLIAGAVLFAISGVVLALPIRRAIGPPPPDLMARDVTIPSRSGSLLRGWMVRGEPGAGAVILLHGIHSDRSAMVARMRFLRQAGYSLLAIDLQGHGESPGRLITFGHLEALDAEASVGFIREALSGERIGVIGTSLGGAATLLGAVPLRAVYPDIRSALANRIAARLGAQAGRFLAPLYLRLMPLVLHVHEEELRPIDRIAGVASPLLLMAGSADRYTTIEESRALFDRAPEPKRFWLVDGAAHVDLAAYAPDAYRVQVLDFFDTYLRGGRAKDHCQVTTGSTAICAGPR
jgi:uncharacterized protein